MSEVVTRIAPSPTGALHIGTARSALFNYLFAKKHEGVFAVRIEDTDRARSTDEYEKDILNGLSWLGLAHDSFARQSEHVEEHTAALETLIGKDAAYVSREKAQDGSGREVEVVRLRNPGEQITFRDDIRGDVTFDTAELGDFVIARSLSEPLYHLAVVVDDEKLGVTHVIRGEDHISNTPRHILLQRALGYRTPAYAHLPLILAPDRSKLSKRTGARSITELRSEGYLPEAVVNYLAMLGWNPDTDQEIFSLDELREIFDITAVQKGGAVFSEEKLRWFNRIYLHNLPSEQQFAYVSEHFPQRVAALSGYNEDTLRRALPLIIERMAVASDLTHLAESGDLDYYFAAPTYPTELLVWKKSDAESALHHLGRIIELLENADNAFDADAVRDIVMPYASEKGKGDVLWPMRVALSGKEKSPDPIAIAAVVGKRETLERLHHAKKMLEKHQRSA